MNSNLLKGKIRENGLTQEDVAKKLNLTLQGFNNKINGKRQFTLDEVVIMCEYLKILDPRDIFFVD